MSVVDNLRPLQPLFSSISHTFHDFSPRIREGFWALGASLLNLVYKGTFFDSNVELHPDESEEDNFDIILDTAEKLIILQPALRPNILTPTMEQIRNQSEKVLTETLNTFYPVKVEPTSTVSSTTTRDNPAPAVPDWLKKWVPVENAQAIEDAPAVADTENETAAAQGSGIDVPPRPVKRRLQRTISDFDKKTKTHRERNQLRNSLIRMCEQ